MDNFYKNKEGYPDPTAYEAITNIEKPVHFKYHPVVYICSPYRGDTEYNTDKAREYSRFAALEGYLPLTPHLLFTQFLKEDIRRERELGLFFGNILLTKCREIWVFGDKITEGMRIEIKNAKKFKMVIRYFDENCLEKKNAPQ